MSQAFPLMILVALPPKMAMTVDRGRAREKKKLRLLAQRRRYLYLSNKRSNSFLFLSSYSLLCVLLAFDSRSVGHNS